MQYVIAFCFKTLTTKHVTKKNCSCHINPYTTAFTNSSLIELATPGHWTDSTVRYLVLQIKLV